MNLGRKRRSRKTMGDLRRRRSRKTSADRKEED